MIEDVKCPNHKIKMKRVTGIHGPYWRCPQWGCDVKANTLGEIIKPKKEDEDEGETFPDGYKPKKRRWEQ